uniref:Uncharacterized protein n=1 Tax=Acrobeloides nanus TaxID=290746 RepID=A0A914C4B9_9BILA
MSEEDGHIEMPTGTQTMNNNNRRHSSFARSTSLNKPTIKREGSSGSLAFHQDPFNKPEHEITLRGRELVIFVVGYLFAVLIILAIFEAVMPIFWPFLKL